MFRSSPVLPLSLFLSQSLLYRFIPAQSPSLSLFSPSIVHARRRLISLFLSPLFHSEVAFLLGWDVPPLLHFSQPRRGIILDGTVDNVY